MSEHDLLYLAYIDEASALVERTVSRRGRVALEGDENLRDATLFRLQTLAESTQRLSADFKASHPEIPWDRVAGFRNRVVHGYLENLDVVWAIVEHDLRLAGCVRAELARRRQLGRSSPERDTGLDIGF